MKNVCVFRLDDISWDMNYENFSLVRDIFLKYDIKPLIGIIPDNNDVKLKDYVGEKHLTQEEFWEEMRYLQHHHGWSIALHGYDHVYINTNGGILNINKRSEFAGLPLQVQIEKLQIGKSILEKNGLEISAFMAPAHSFDWNTVEALKRVGIYTITDGYDIYPFYKNDMRFIPCVDSGIPKKIIGVRTACLHINTWDKKLFLCLENQIIQKKKYCVYYSTLLEETRKYTSLPVLYRICFMKIFKIKKIILKRLKKFIKR